MKYYRNKHELPLKNWFMIEVNNFDLSYLLKEPKTLNKRTEKKLYKLFVTILNSLSNINSDILLNYVRWQANYTLFNAKRIQNKKFTEKDYENTFRTYLLTLEKSFNQFRVIENSFNPDYKELFMEKIGCHLDEFQQKYFLKRLEDFENIRFYTWDELSLFLKNYPEMHGFTFSEMFYKEFISRKIIKIDNLVELDTYLIDIYQENGLYDKYQKVRYELFDMKRLDGKPKKDKTPFEDYANLCAYLKIPYNDEIPLAAYEGLVNRAKIQQERENKPKAAGNGRL